MSIVLNQLNSNAMEPILTAIGVIAAIAVILLAIKGKLRDWFLR